MAKAIIFLGIQGCGKGTQSELLAERHSFSRLVMSDILEKGKETDPAVAETIAACKKDGVLAPSHLMLRLLRGELDKLPAGANIVMDGTDRKVVQTRGGQVFLRKRNAERIYVHLYFRPQDEFNFVHERLRRRVERMLAERKAPRPDDLDPNAVRNRIDIFRRENGLVLAYLRSIGAHLVEIEAHLPIEDIYGRIAQAACLENFAGLPTEMVA